METGGHSLLIALSNVDRIFALWQAVNPDSFITSEVNSVGTFTEAPGFTENISSHLTPFHSDADGSFHTPATARPIAPFGYSYPEIVDWGVNASTLATNVRIAVNKLYNSQSSVTRRDTSPLLRRQATKGLSDGLDEEHQWAIQIEVDK